MKNNKNRKFSKEKLIHGGLVNSFFTTLLSILEKFYKHRNSFIGKVFLSLLDLIRNHSIRGSPLFIEFAN